MPFDLPDAPLLDQVITTPDGTTYIYDGTKWVLVIGGDFLPLVGGTLTGQLVAHSDTTIDPQILITHSDPMRYARIGFQVDPAFDWKLGVDGPTSSGWDNAFRIIDHTMVKFVIYPSATGTPMVPLIIAADGALTTGGNGALTFRNILPVGDIVRFEDSTGAEVGSVGSLGMASFNSTVSGYSLETRSGNIVREDAAGVSQSMLYFYDDHLSIHAPSGLGHRPIAMYGERGYPPGEHISETHYNAKKHYWGPNQNGASVDPDDFFGSWDGEAFTVNGSPDLDVAGTFHDATLRLTANTQSWDLIGATPDSGSAPGSFIIADATTGTRRLIIDPGATDSATAVQITAAGNLSLASLNFATSWSITETRGVPGVLTFTDLVYSIDRFIIESGLGAPMVIDTTGALTIGGNQFHMMGSTGSILAPGSGPMIAAIAGKMSFKPDPDGIGYSSWDFVGDTGVAVASIGWNPANAGLTLNLYTAAGAANSDVTIGLGSGAGTWYLEAAGNSSPTPGDLIIHSYLGAAVEHARFLASGGVVVAGAVEASGGFTVNGVPVGGGGGLTQAEADVLYANIAGDTFTGPVLLAGPPTLPLHAATMAWVESVIGAAGGGTITGVTAGAGLTGGGTTGTVTVSLTAPVTIALGGTGATDAAAALTALGGLSQATGDARYLPIGTDLFTQAEADLLYLNISTGDYLTTAEGNAAYLPIATDLFTQADADLLYLPLATDLLTQVEADARYLGLAGGTLTGPLVLSGPPTLALHAATMAYVDAAMGAGGGGTITGVTAGVGLAGGGITGTVIVDLEVPVAIASGGTGAITAAAALTALGGLSQATADTLYLGIATDLFTQAEADLRYMPIASDFLTQAEADALYLTPTVAAATYLPLTTDLFTQAEADARYVGLAGSTMTGPLLLSGPPTLALHAATMQYVLDSMGAAGGGTITGVTAGAGLAGGGTTGVVTVSLTIPVAIASGGTGATTAATALTALGGLSQATADTLYLSIATDLLTPAEADALYLTQAEGDARYLPLATDLLTKAEADAAYLPIATDLFTQADADLLYLTPTVAAATYLPLTTDLFTQAEADLRYMPIASDFLTQAEADALYLTAAAAAATYLPLTTDLFTQAEADALFLTPAEGDARYLAIATDLLTQAEADARYKPIAEPTIATVADVAPAAPVQGQVWFDSANVRLCVWFNDGTSSQWVVV